VPPYLTSEWVAAGAAVLAAVIGPLVSLLILRKQNASAERVARMQISASLVSASRQAWIEKLRDTIAEFQAALLNLGFQGGHSVSRGLDEAERVERAVLLRARIALLINPNEPDHKRLLELVDRCLDLTYASGPEPRRELAAVSQIELTGLAQVILKREWVRVKTGETTDVLKP
jgi:hypothetical protein